MRIMLAENDTILADGLAEALRQSAHSVDWAKTGAEARDFLTSHDYDLVLLDLGLPRMDGLEVLRILRGRDTKTPVLIITARDSVEDRVTGLDAGADDYLVKPFALSELEARIRALMRRGQATQGPAKVIDIGPIQYDVEARRVRVRGEPVELSAREFGVFEVLAQRLGRVVSKDQLVEQLCQVDVDVNPGAIEVYIHRLRKKLESAGVPIRTIRGLGYLLEKPRGG